MTPCSDRIHGSAASEPAADGGEDHAFVPPGLARAIAREQSELDDELQRANQLLHEGMAKLHDFFDELRSQSVVQLKLAATLVDPAASESERQNAIERMFAASERMRQRADTSMLALQLDDMLGQLLECTRNRVQGLATLTSALADVASEPSATAHAHLTAALKEIERHADNRMVDQETLSVGNVELF
jgi:hypothetical protein